jgi:hypothetical protein
MRCTVAYPGDGDDSLGMPMGPIYAGLHCSLYASNTQLLMGKTECARGCAANVATPPAGAVLCVVFLFFFH